MRIEIFKRDLLITMSKTNTLLNYFNKTPNKPEVKKDSSAKSEIQTAPSIALGDLVWAKVEGHPWWPAVACNPLESNRFLKGIKNNDVHVHFFDTPPTRAWVKSKFVAPYNGSQAKEAQRNGKFHSTKAKLKDALAMADSAQTLPVPERIEMVKVTETQTENDQEEDMEVDDLVKDIDFDDDIFDKELDSSKENDESALSDKPEGQTADSKSAVSASSRPSRQSKVKRQRLVESGDEAEASEEDYKPGKQDDSSDEGEESVEEEHSEEAESDEVDDSPVKTGVKRKRPPAKLKKAATPSASGKSKKAATPSTSKSSTPSSALSHKTKSKLANFTASVTEGAAPADASGRSFPHLALDFLNVDKIKDAMKRPKDHPDYDPRTLHIPDSFLQKTSPAMRQWWDIKSKHFDTVLFFKMGKFYELFHMDAVIAVNELGLIFMKGEYAHAGFPEISFSRYADTLIQKGFKVARIEQTETPAMMEERMQKVKGTRCDKVVRREVCSIQTRGTRRYSFIDGDTTDPTNQYLLAICEKELTDAASVYGVSFVDTTIGQIHLGQFQDDRFSSRLRTLVSHHPPVQVLFEKGKVSSRTHSVLSSVLSSAIKEGLRPGAEFWDSTTTLKNLVEGTYFKDEATNTSVVPELLKTLQDPIDNLGFTAVEDRELSVRALGAVTWCLQECLMDEEILSLKLMQWYEPVDSGVPREVVPKEVVTMDVSRRMVLDAVTLSNLDVMTNSSTGTTEGTLLECLDHCTTPFGKRLLKQWLCSPLCNPAGISDRLQAIDDLTTCPELTTQVKAMMAKIPDLERQLNKIHSLGNAKRSKSHPDSRAIFFEEVIYSKRKIDDFLSTLAGFKIAQDIASKFKGTSQSFQSTLLRQATSFEPIGKFPNLSQELAFFDNAFDHEKAKKDGSITPARGVDAEYDSATNGIQKVKTDLDSYLSEQKKRIGCSQISYWGTGKSRYQMEIPEERKVPDEYLIMSNRKDFRRYRTRRIDELLAELTEFEEQKECAVRDIMRRVFHRFDESYPLWLCAVQCLSVLDVLMSLTTFSTSDSGMCKPQFVLPSEQTQPFLEIRDGKHPCVGRSIVSSDFIPNDTVVGQAQDDIENSTAQLVLVTGPNMGGKSTLMRQVGAIVILAQLGCYVPAEKCVLTPADRIFTRLGASDRIMSGESTFFVELSETSAILQHATQHSLVLMDELGRGTATYDGTAIACSVVQDLSCRVRCRTLFSTHYHSLVDEFTHDANVRTGHMACMVENESDDPSEETITFLYKFVTGVCPKSYGFNAARLASIPDNIISLAHKKAVEFQDINNHIKTFRKIMTVKSFEDLQEFLKNVLI